MMVGNTASETNEEQRSPIVKLLRELSRIQHERGYLDDATLRELSKQQHVPLYQLEGLVSFYPHFRRTPPPQFSVHVCRDVSCAMGGCSKLSAELRKRLKDRSDVEIREVSCIGRCDSAPAVSINEEPLTDCGRDANALLERVLQAVSSAEGSGCRESVLPDVSTGLAPVERHLTATSLDNEKPLPARLVRVEECLETSIHPDKPGGARVSNASCFVALRCASTGASPAESLMFWLFKLRQLLTGD